MMNQNNLTTKHTKSTKEKPHNIFVSFVPFVVK